jgi:hypothetical protein
VVVKAVFVLAVVSARAVVVVSVSVADIAVSLLPL